MKVVLTALLWLCVLTGAWAPYTAAQTSLFDQLMGTPGDEEPLPPDEAFRLHLERHANGGTAYWEIAKGYYLYRDKTKIKYGDATAQLKFPPSQTMRDEFFGETQVYRELLEVPFAVDVPSDSDGMLSITYQGCADLGLCYPAITKKVRFMELALVDAPAADPQTSAPVSEQFRIAEYLLDKSLLAIILSFLGFGILLAFTPCVLPMIPILSGVVISGNAMGSTKRALALSLSYVISMALVYAIVGAIVGATGENFQIWFQTPWVIGVFSAVFVLLALSMFGLYEIKMPAVIQNRFMSAGAERKGRLSGAAIMGAASALIVGPCVTPPLVGALLFIAQTGDAVTGGVALFSLGLGMGIPLLAVGSSLGKWLPRPGAVLDMIKILFGILLLGVAVWLIDRVVVVAISQLLAGILLLSTASYLLWSDVVISGWKYVWKGIGIGILVYGLMLLVGAATGGSSFLTPLEKLSMGGAMEPHQSLAFTRVSSVADLQQALNRAQQQQRSVMLDFYADWCVSCKEMEAFTFSKPQVHQTLSDTVLLQADVTANNASDQALLAHFNLYGPPAILFFNRRGEELERSRVVGFMSATEFVVHVRNTLGIGADKKVL